MKILFFSIFLIFADGKSLNSVYFSAVSFSRFRNRKWNECTILSVNVFE